MEGKLTAAVPLSPVTTVTITDVSLEITGYRRINVCVSAIDYFGTAGD